MVKSALRRLRVHSGAVAMVLLLSPFAYVVGDGLIEAKACEAQREALTIAMLDLNEALLASDQAQRVQPEASKAPSETQTETQTDTQVAESDEARSVTMPMAGTELDLGEFAFVWEGELLLDGDADPRLGHGRVSGEVNYGFESVYAQRQVSWYANPQLGAMQGKTFVLYDGAGETCRVATKGVRLQAAMSGDLWALVDGDNDPLGALIDSGVLEAAQNGRAHAKTKWLEALLLERVMGSAQNWLLASYEPISGDCEGSLWARQADLPAPVLFTLDESDDAREQVRERFRASAAHAEAQALFVEAEHEYTRAVASSWAGHEAETLSVQSWRHADRGAVELASVGYAGECGDADTYTAMSWRGERALGDDALGDADAVFELDSVVFALTVDEDSDDRRTLIRLDDSVEVARHAAIEFYGCSC